MREATTVKMMIHKTRGSKATENLVTVASKPGSGILKINPDDLKR